MTFFCSNKIAGRYVFFSKSHRNGYGNTVKIAITVMLAATAITVCRQCILSWDSGKVALSVVTGG